MTPLIYGPGPEPPVPLQAEPDLAGLAVDDVGGRPTGEVYGVLIESDSGLIRYVDLSVDALGRHVLAPIGHVRIDEGADGLRLALRAVTREDLAAIPEYRSGEVPADAYENQILAAYSRLFYGERYYAHPAYDHSRLYVGEHPVEQTKAEAPTITTLALLSDLSDWRLAAGEPDIRGWIAVDEGNASMGTVRGLMVDPAARRVRYLLVDIEAHGPVLVPVGYAEVIPSLSAVRLSGLRADDLRSLPPFAGDTLTREQESALRAALDAVLTGERRFARPEFASH